MKNADSVECNRDRRRRRRGDRLVERGRQVTFEDAIFVIVGVAVGYYVTRNYLLTRKPV